MPAEAAKKFAEKVGKSLGVKITPATNIRTPYLTALSGKTWGLVTYGLPRNTPDRKIRDALRIFRSGGLAAARERSRAGQPVKAEFAILRDRNSEEPLISMSFRLRKKGEKLTGQLEVARSKYVFKRSRP